MVAMEEVEAEGVDAAEEAGDTAVTAMVSVAEEGMAAAVADEAGVVRTSIATIDLMTWTTTYRPIPGTLISLNYLRPMPMMIGGKLR